MGRLMPGKSNTPHFTKADPDPPTPSVEQCIHALKSGLSKEATDEWLEKLSVAMLNRDLGFG